jgi:NTP pyrophosphatase (non-canonical NTP hydrolase)
MTLNDLVEQSHRLAKEKGWYEGGERNIPEALALIHSEVSEALEEYRRYGRDAVTYKQHNVDTGKPEGFAIELADVVIRVADLCGYLGIDLEDAVETKYLYNRTRAYRHGNKVA